MALIDKETIRKEIERLDEKYRTLRVNGTKQQAKEADLVVHVLLGLSNFLDTLLEQPVEMGNEEKIINFFDAIGDCGFSQYDIFRLKSIWEDMSYSIPKQEQPVEGLEEEYKDYVENDPVYSKLVNRNAGLGIARHFYELGLNSRK